MKKKFKMEDLDCANCAAKMEERIRKLEGVTDVNISFMAQKIALEADDDKFESILEEAQKIVKSVDPECSILF